MKWFKKVLPTLAGAAVGGLTGSTILGTAAAVGTRAATDQKINLMTIGMDIAGAYGGTQLPALFDTSPAMGGATGGGGSSGGWLSGLGGGGGSPAAAGVSGGTAAVAANAGLTTKPSGLLAGVLNSDFLKSPIVGHALSGLGQALAQPDPGQAAGDAAEAQLEARRRHVAQNYRRVRAPSDQRMIRTGG